MIIPVSRIADIGLSKDLPAQRLPLHAWTELRNAEMAEGKIQAILSFYGFNSGRTGLNWIKSYRTDTGPIMVLGTPTELFAYDYTSFQEITFWGGAGYTGGIYDFWQGDVFQGFGIMNNGVDVPQVWNPMTVITPVIAMPNWPTTLRAKVVRGFSGFLVALDVSKSSVRDKRLVKWSHSADPNTLPSSWDETDATKDAGEISLTDGQDGLVDCMSLGDVNIIYSDTQTWAMRFVGGQSIFAFRNLFPLSGLLALGCVQKFNAGHFAVTETDIIVHNGSVISSVADKSIRRWFLRNLSSDYYKMTRVIRFLSRCEMWICFSTYGAVLDLALVWNWKYNTWTIHDLPDVVSVTSVANRFVYSPDSWESSDYTWAGETTETWSSTPVTRQTETLEFTTRTDLYREATPGVPVTVHLERTGIANISETETDEYSYKELVAVRPSFSGPAGTTISISVGFQENIDDTVTWSDTGVFTIGTDVELALNATGRYLAVKFIWTESATAVQFFGYALDVVLLKEGL